MNYGKKGVRAKQKALNSKATKIERKLLLGLVKLALAAFIGIGICGTAAGLGAFKGQATVVYDCAGNEIDQYVSSNSNRLRIESIDELPDYLGKAFVAIEDERFYLHNGIDFKAMLRSGYQFFKSGFKQTQGASTITQQKYDQKDQEKASGTVSGTGNFQVF